MCEGTMTVHQIKDHKHTEKRIKRTAGEFGITEVYECQDPECEYRHITFRDVTQTALGAYK